MEHQPTVPIRVTAAESEVAQRRAAAALAARGVTRGERVVVLARPSPAYLAVAIGALRVGVVPVLLNPTLTEAEVRPLVADAEPRLVLREPDLPGLVAGPAEADLAPVPLARPMMYTSGTTGRPKGVWSGVLPEAEAAQLVTEERDLWGFSHRDVNLVVSPLHHSAPLRFATGTLLAGGTVVLLGPFSPQALAHAIAAEAPTTAFMVPAHLQRLFSLPEHRLPDLAGFRLLAHAGAPMPRALKEHTIPAFGEHAVWEFYGSTEGQFTACAAAEWRARPGTVGRARPGRQLSIDGDGTIWCTVPPHARFTYWRDPEKTDAAWRGDAFTVGDLGRLDDDGYLYLDGRRTDLVISGGVNVYPLEVEVALLEHPDVREAAVFGVPDDRWGQAVWAAVVGDVTDTDLEDFLATRLAPYKRPKRILHVAEIPVTPTGKVRRDTLATDLGVHDRP